MNTNLIIDTDAGFAPDDTIALALALNSPEFTPILIVTGDEVAGKRYRFVRRFLELMGREELRVVEGVDLRRNDFLAHEFINDARYPLDIDYLAEMKKVTDGAERITYLGLQGLTNLANYFQVYPQDIPKYDVFQIGGSLEYKREPKWVEHNLALSPGAARTVLSSGAAIHLITADTTFNPAYEITAGSTFFRELLRSRHPAHQLMVRQCVEWCETKEQRPFIHDPVTVAAALQRGYVEYYSPTAVEMDDKGNLHRVKAGQLIYVSRPETQNWKIWNLLEERLFI